MKRIAVACLLALSLTGCTTLGALGSFAVCFVHSHDSRGNCICMQCY